MTNSKLKKELIDAIIEARHMTQERLAKDPGNNLFNFANRQLDEIESLSKQPSTITVDDTKHIQLGLMAARELGQHEEHYADALCLVNYLFDKLVNNDE